MEFPTVLLLARKTATGVEVPPEVVEALGSGRRPAVTVTLNAGHSYPSAVASTGGKFLVPVGLAVALDAEPAARAAVEALSCSNQRRHTLSVEGANAADTRAGRVAKAVTDLAGGR